jgi:uncharacterized membrane protein
VLGTLLILGCVGLISFGGTNDEKEVDKIFLALALSMAIVTGLTLSLNTVNIQYVISTGFNVDQANYDGGFLIGMLYLPLTIYYRSNFDLDVYIKSSLAVIFGTIGIISFSRALQHGKAGPVQAIENTKTIVQSMMAALILKQIPTLM